MTDDEIDALERLAAAAKPGPWRWVWANGYHMLTNSLNDDQPYPHILSDGSAGGEYSPDIDVGGTDAQFIAAARSAVPALCAALRAERKKVQALRDALMALMCLPGKPTAENVKSVNEQCRDALVMSRTAFAPKETP